MDITVGMDRSSRISESPGDSALQSPIAEFVTSTGERVRVSGRSYSSSPSARVGDAVTVAYSPSHPRDAQFLTWKEFPLVPAGAVLGFALVILLLWISVILVSGDSTFDDPFHLLPAVISHFRLNPFRFPVLFLLSVVIPLCGLGTYVHSKQAIDLRSNGIKAVGHVVGVNAEISPLSDGTAASGVFPMITFEDASGTKYTIRRSLAKPLARLKAGDKVEVIYLAGHPDEGIVNTWDELWPSPIFFGLMMFAFLVLLRLVLKGIIW